MLRTKSLKNPCQSQWTQNELQKMIENIVITDSYKLVENFYIIEEELKHNIKGAKQLEKSLKVEKRNIEVPFGQSTSVDVCLDILYTFFLITSSSQFSQFFKVTLCANSHILRAIAIVKISIQGIFSLK